MSVPLLIIGTSLGGPANQLTKVESLAEAESLFLPFVYDTLTYSATGASGSLSYPAYGNNVETLLPSGSSYVPVNFYNLQASGSLVTFGSVGSSGQCLLRYIPQPEESHLIPALREVLRQSGPLPLLYRVGGQRATLTLGPLLLTCDSPGSLGNGRTVSVSGSVLTFFVASTLGTAGKTYPILTQYDLCQRINQDQARGLIDFNASTDSPLSTSVAPGTFSSSGGADVSLDKTTLVNVLSNLDITGVETVLIAGGVAPGDAPDILAALTDASIYPTLYFLGAPLSTAMLPASGFPALPADGRVFYIPGHSLSSNNPGTSLNRQTGTLSLAATFAGQWTAGAGNPLHQPCGLSSLFYEWDAVNLSQAGSGLTYYGNTIGNGIAPIHVNTLGGTDPLRSRLLQVIGRRLYNLLDPLIGKGNTADALQSLAQSALLDLPFARAQEVLVTDLGDTLKINVDVSLYGSVTSLIFVLQTTA